MADDRVKPAHSKCKTGRVRDVRDDQGHFPQGSECGTFSSIRITGKKNEEGIP